MASAHHRPAHPNPINARACTMHVRKERPRPQRPVQAGLIWTRMTSWLPSSRPSPLGTR
jgi:hypothetical protein